MGSCNPTSVSMTSYGVTTVDDSRHSSQSEAVERSDDANCPSNSTGATCPIEKKMPAPESQWRDAERKREGGGEEAPSLLFSPTRWRQWRLWWGSWYQRLCFLLALEAGRPRPGSEEQRRRHDHGAREVGGGSGSRLRVPSREAVQPGEGRRKAAAAAAGKTPMPVFSPHAYLEAGASFPPAVA